jgi:hypothetical protein
MLDLVNSFVIWRQSVCVPGRIHHTHADRGKCKQQQALAKMQNAWAHTECILNIWFHAGCAMNISLLSACTAAIDWLHRERAREMQFRFVFLRFVVYVMRARSVLIKCEKHRLGSSCVLYTHQSVHKLLCASERAFWLLLLTWGCDGNFQSKVNRYGCCRFCVAVEFVLRLHNCFACSDNVHTHSDFFFQLVIILSHIECALMQYDNVLFATKKCYCKTFWESAIKYTPLCRMQFQLHQGEQ